jgi:hypothetical protein
MRKILVAIAATVCLSTAAFAGEQISKDLPAKDLPAKDVPAKEIPVKEVPTKDIPAKDVLAKDVPAKDLPAKDLPAKDVPPKDLPTKTESIIPPGYHQANWKDGHGASWQAGRHTYGFEGYFGGCHYTGHAGPHGYHLDKVC